MNYLRASVIRLSCRKRDGEKERKTLDDAKEEEEEEQQREGMYTCYRCVCERNQEAGTKRDIIFINKNLARLAPKEIP